MWLLVNLAWRVLSHIEHIAFQLSTAPQFGGSSKERAREARETGAGWGGGLEPPPRGNVRTMLGPILLDIFLFCDLMTPPKICQSVYCLSQGLICKVSKTMKIKPGYLGTAIPHYDVQVR